MNDSLAPFRPPIGTVAPPGEKLPLVSCSLLSKVPLPLKSTQACSTAAVLVLFTALTMKDAVLPGTIGVANITPFSSSPAGVDVPNVCVLVLPSSPPPILPAIGSGLPSASLSTDAPSIKSADMACLGGESLPEVL